MNIFTKIGIMVIFCLPTLALDYSINLMWLYDKTKPEKELVFPEKYEKTTIKEDIREWAQKNPKASINLWFDSQTVTPEQVKKSTEYFANLNKELKRDDKNQISLKDIRSLAEVQKNPEVFSDKTPIYFHTDILRLIAAIPYLEKCDSSCYFVYSDLSVKPMDENELFDQETVTKLAKFGALFAEAPKIAGDIGTLDLEHIFHIISNSKPNLIKALKEKGIDENIRDAKKALKENQANKLTSLVFLSIPHIFEYFYEQEKLPHDETIWNKELNKIRIPTKKVISTREREIKEMPSNNNVQPIPL